MTSRWAANLLGRPPLGELIAADLVMNHGDRRPSAREQLRDAAADLRSSNDSWSYYGIGPVELELRSDLREAADDFAVLYRDQRRLRSTGGRAIRMEVRAEGRWRWGFRRYAIIGDGEEVFGRLRRDEVLPYLEWAINYRVIAQHSEYLQLHAATLGRQGRGVILVGQSGSGKSTLAAALAARGWEYLSDEFALIDPDTLLLHALPKALCIKAGSFDLVQRLGLPLWRRRPYVKAFKGRVGYISPSDLNVATDALPVRLIVFPRYRGGGGTSLFPVSRSRAAFSLAANSFNRGVFGDRLVSTLGRIVRQARCVALEPDGLEESCALLESLLDVDHKTPAARPDPRPRNHVGSATCLTG